MLKVKYQPIIIGVALLASLLTHTGKTWANIISYSMEDLHCLAMNIYHEARGESTHGKLAVAQVTLNRVEHKDYANTICKVVYQPGQFSWTVDKKLRKPHGPAWTASLSLARKVLESNVAIPGFRALNFHSIKITPAWAKNSNRVAKIGNHIFYN